MIEAVQQGLAPLFTPFSGGGLELKNRFAMAPMTRWFSPGEFPGADVAAYYRRRAENEVGLIVTEGTTIDHPASSHSLITPAFHGKALDGWRRVVGEVHEAGAKIVPQIWHVGIMRDPRKEPYPNDDVPSASPSGMYRAGSKQIAEPSSPDVIRTVVDSFARAAADARELGFDGVEIHGAHGYLLDQFLWDEVNKRTDEYGGEPERRNRFAVEVIRAIRAAVGPDFPVIFRMSQWKQQDYKARLVDSPEALAAMFKPIADAGVDIFHCSQRRYWEPEFDGSPLNLAGWIKQLTGRPAISVGSVGLGGMMSVTDIGAEAAVDTNLEPLAQRIAGGEFDVIAIGRALLADPEWVRKVKEGRFDELHAYDKSAVDKLF